MFWTSSSLDVIPARVPQEEGHTGFAHLPSAVLALIFLARRIQPFLSLVDDEVDFCVLRPFLTREVFEELFGIEGQKHSWEKKTFSPVFMVTKSCTKILNFSTRFSCRHFAVEYFVTLPMGKKSCRWENLMFGHGFDKKLV